MNSRERVAYLRFLMLRSRAESVQWGGEMCRLLVAG